MWQEIFLPIIELKSYSKYIVYTLSKLLDQHAKMDSTKLSQDQFLNLLDTVNNKRVGLQKEYSSDLIAQLVKIKVSFLHSSIISVSHSRDLTNFA